MADDLFAPEPDALVFGTRVLIAAVLGAALGLEREWRGKEAGLRTNTLIAIGAALFTAMSTTFANDGARIAAQIVTGVGFLGAGAIMRRDGGVHGLTTAAMIWVNAAIGMAVGAGHIRLGIIVTGLTLVAMLVLIPLDKVFERKNTARRT